MSLSGDRARAGVNHYGNISVNYHYITVLYPFNLLIHFKCYNTF